MNILGKNFFNFSRVRKILKTIIFFVLFLSFSSQVNADRIKDLATAAAARSNQLIGYGLVVGLQGTGDGASIFFTTQSSLRSYGNKLYSNMI